MGMKENLLDKYYKGETNLAEENELKNLILGNDEESTEKDVFAYFIENSFVPKDVEESVFKVVKETQQKRKWLKMRWYSFTSAAAVAILLITVFLNSRKAKINQIENEFFVMEQALFQISESIKPQEQNDMLVLWVDNDVEIIIN